MDVYAAEDELSDYGGAYAAGGNAFDESGGGCEWNGLPLECSLLDYVGRTHRKMIVGTARRSQGREGGGGQSDAYIWREKWEDSFVAGSGDVTGFDEKGQPIYNLGTRVATNVSFFEVLPGLGAPLRGRVSQRQYLTMPLSQRLVSQLQGIMSGLSDPNGTCAKFVGDLLKAAETRFPNVKSAGAYDPYTLFNKVRDQRGFVYGDAVRRYWRTFSGSTVRGSIITGDAQVELAFPSSTNKWSLNATTAAPSVLHELLHVAGFSDSDLSIAFALMENRAEPDLTGLTQEQKARLGDWNDALLKNCFPKK